MTKDNYIRFEAYKLVELTQNTFILTFSSSSLSYTNFDIDFCFLSEKNFKMKS